MKVVEILRMSRDLLKFVSENGLKSDDYMFVGLYYEYEYRRKNHEKYAVTLSSLSKKYKVSETTVKRLIRRLGREV